MVKSGKQIKEEKKISKLWKITFGLINRTLKI